MDGAVIDGGWYLAAVRYAGGTPWLQDLLGFFAAWGLPLVVLVVLVSWWQMRSRPAAKMAGALWALLAALIGYGLNDVIKELVREPRPCRRFPAAPTLAPCDLATDYAFPSNHATVMAAAAIALLAVGTLPAVLAFALTLLAGVSRVALGMHYPHDVLAGLLLGAAVGCVGLLARRPLTTWVERRRAGGWRLLATSAGRSTRNKY